MYIIMTDKDYQKAISDGEKIEDLGPDFLGLYEEGDFNASFGKDGTVSSCDYHDTAKKQWAAAEELVRFYGTDICYTKEDGSLNFYTNAAEQYAKNKMEELSSRLRDMSKKDYLDTGAYILRTIIRSNTCFIHTYSYAIGNDATDPSYTMSADDYILDVIQYCEKLPKLRVTQTLWCKW